MGTLNQANELKTSSLLLFSFRSHTRQESLLLLHKRRRRRWEEEEEALGEEEEEALPWGHSARLTN